MIQGVSHITFVVHNLEKASIFLRSIFDAQEVYSSGNKKFSISKEKFFIINNIWIAIMEGDALSKKTYNHIAFKVSENDFDKYVEKVKKMDVEIKESRVRIDGEGRSLYFYDYDNHLFEIHTGEIESRLAKYNSI